MNKLTTISTIKKAAPLALLAVVMSGSAFAGPKGERPSGPKYSIDVENECSVNGAYLDIKTTVTPSGSKPGDGGGDVGQPTADAAFKGEICETNKGGKEKCSQGFLPVGNAQDMFGSYMASINLCATKESGAIISKGTAVNAFVNVPVELEDGTVQATWVSNCDDIAKPEDFQWVEVDGNWVYMDVVDQSDVKVPADILCP
jgi:hypothetical protein